MKVLFRAAAVLQSSISIGVLAASQAPCALWTFDGVTANGDRDLGFSVASAGDVDGDGYDDLIVGAHRSNGDLFAEGRAYVFHGSDTGLGAVHTWMMEGDQASAWFGHSVAAPAT